MLFTSVAFVIFFTVLMALLAVYRSHDARLWLLLVASYVFYGYWNVWYLILIALCSLWGWGLGYLMYVAETERQRRLWLAVSLVLSLGTLAVFKYANFFGENLAALLAWEDWQPLDIVLPVGISFFTFQTMSYTIDLYRRNVELCRNPLHFFVFVAFFPQLVAGPIVRASDFLPQLRERIRITLENFRAGAQIFLGGALQKVVIADNLSVFVDGVYAEPLMYSTSTLWLAVAAYSVQIFCDFSGYSLMAIGLARILGFRLPENFRMPYVSQSVGEFWRRWHISLSTWLRDYLYISLGGNRRGVTRTQVNMGITMVIGGLWHGASWNFVLWGALHGLALALHRGWRAWRGPVRHEGIMARRVAPVGSWLLTLVFVSLVWVPFRSPDFSTTLTVLNGLVPGRGGPFDWHHSMTLFILTAVVFWHLVYQFRPLWMARIPFSTEQLRSVPAMTAVGLTVTLVLILAPTNVSPFIYFQF